MDEQTEQDYTQITSARGLVIAARMLITDPAHWTKGAWARDKGGDTLVSEDDRAVCWCARGAVRYVGQRTTLPYIAVERAADTIDTVARELDPRSGTAISFNDRPETRHEDVLRLMDLTAERLDDL